MRIIKKRNPLVSAALFLCLLLLPVSVWADDFADYKTAVGSESVVNLPTVTGGWFVAVDYFPEGSTALIDGKFEAEGRIIAANDNKIYLQRTYGSSQWDVVATVPGTMDPSFIHVSPDGTKIALGAGYGAPLAIIDPNTLSAANPPLLWDYDAGSITSVASGVSVFPQINFYDGDWVDSRYFVINGGAWPTNCEPPYEDNPNCTFASGVGVVDTETSNPSTHVGEALITGIPGASADVDVDDNGNLLTGLGMKTLPENRTGEVKVWAADEWQPEPGTFAANTYEGSGAVVAENILSAAYLGEDAEGNLHVGGGDAFGTGGVSENGYAAIIRAGIVDAIADGTRITPVTDGDKTDNGEYKFFAPDPCQDDSATGIIGDSWGRGLAVMWNPTYYEANGTCYGTAGSATDYWNPGITPRLTIYYPGSATDSDGDGVVDAADNAYLTANAGQEDTDGDGYGNAVDADLNNDGIVDYSDFSAFQSFWMQSGTAADMDSSGTVDYSDYSLFQGKWLTTAPYY